MGKDLAQLKSDRSNRSRSRRRRKQEKEERRREDYEKYSNIDFLNTMRHGKVGVSKDLRGRKDYKRALKAAGRAFDETNQ